MIILNETDDRKTFDKISTIIEGNQDKKILLAYRKVQGEEGGMINPSVFKGSYYVIPMQYSKSMIEITKIINEAINENFDIVVLYRPDLSQEDTKNIKELETGIEIILSSVK